jgi:hypothetical protein
MRFISNGVPTKSTGAGKNSSIDGPQNVTLISQSAAMDDGTPARAEVTIVASRAFS